MAQAQPTPLQKKLLRGVFLSNTSSYGAQVLPLRRRRKVSGALLVAAAGFLAVLLAAIAARAQSASAPASAAQGIGEMLVQQFIPLFGAALLAAATWASSRAAAWMNAHTKNAYALGVYQRLDDAVMTAVKALEQTVVKDLVTLNAGDRAKLKSDALVMVKSYMGVSGIALLENIVGVDQLTGFLQAKIEAAVHTVNAAAPAPAPAPATAAK